MITEHKFIIVRVKGRLYHFKSEREDHLIIARRHNCQDTDIIEKGMLADTLQIWECYDKKHLHKIKTKTPYKWIGFDIEDYEETLKREWWRK